MSTDLLANEWQGRSEDAPQNLLPPRNLGATDDDSTPKSEVPVAVNLMTPGGTQEMANMSLDAAASDYFTLKANAVETRSEETQSLNVTPAAGRTSASDTHSTASDDPPGVPPLQPIGRPSAQTAISNFSADSSDSAATLRPAYSDAEVPTLSRPAFPNQSYAALHSQHHPAPHHPSASRRPGAKPHHIFTFSSAIASLHANGTRSAISSPSLAPSVGLFSLGNTPFNQSLSSAETPGTYASPFLHFTHRTVPKETHVADVEKDPISGRKLINEYEIMDELGRGTHGKVKIARDLNTEDTHVAIKIVERFSKRRRLGKLGTTEDKVKKEVAILKKARHPNVVALLEVIDDPTRKKVYIVLEWVERGEIFWRHKPHADFREIVKLEARRYERERGKLTDSASEEEDVAVFQEVRRRLAKTLRRRARKQRKDRQLTEDHPAHWSMELARESDCEGSDNDDDDDRLSRISSVTTAESVSGSQQAEQSHEWPRVAVQPSPSTESMGRPAPENQHHLTPTYRPHSSASSSRPIESTGLEGTMYGPYEPSDPILEHSRRSEDLSRTAREILDSDLDSELEYVPVMTMEQIRGAFRDTLLGLQYLHYQGIVHRDIKPPNLLMTKDNRVKISDFGVSYLGRPVHEGEPGEDMSEHEAQDLDDEAKELAKTVGTPAFYAPELCITDPTDDPLPVTKAIDVWALGITLFCMLFARTPFVDSEFVVMRQIADENVYIPHQRLKPVDYTPRSRSSSNSRNASPMTPDRRKECELIYEEVGVELHDLLTRLLVKDPRRRITLEEVRHHPWVLTDLADPSRWIEQTYPNFQNQGKKIEVSKEELNTAVVPLQFLDNIKSTARKLTDTLLGLGKSRGRATSNAGSQQSGSPAPSASSSSSAIHQEARRHSLLGDESIFSALKASRETSDHSFTKNASTSPENERRGGFFDAFVRATRAPSDTSGEDRLVSSRPAPQRAMTVTSTAGSVRTVKQSDFRPSVPEESPPPSPGVPGTPMALASPGGHGLGGLLGGASRHIMRAVRESSAHGAIDRRSLGNSRRSFESLDSYAEPSLALSQTNAAGCVQQPDVLREPTPSSSTHGSPFNSRPVSVAISEHLNPFDVNVLTRCSSHTSSASNTRATADYYDESVAAQSRSHSRTAPESSPEDWERADQERVRRLVKEMQDEANRSESPPRSASVAPESEGSGACLSSPDDHRRHQPHKHQDHCHHPGRGDTLLSSIGDFSNPEMSNEPSPSGRLSQFPSAMLSSSSDLGSAVSMSISNPSVPSAISEASSVDVYPDYYQIEDHRKRHVSSDETLNRSGKPAASRDYFDEGYVPDEEAAVDSDYGENSDSSSDSDGGLVMSRRRSAAKQGGRSGLSLALEEQQTKERRNTGHSVRSKASSRSGSNSTMKKVLRRSSEEDNNNNNKNHRSSLDVHAE